MASRKVIVFGGNGFVGSHVCKNALAAGWQVVVGCRSGAAVNPQEPWVSRAEWVEVDALDRPSVYSTLDAHKDASAVITTIGLLTTDRKKAQRVNGDANVNIAAAVYESKTISRLVLMSAARMPPLDRWGLKGYYEGKERAERALRETLSTRSVTLQPGMIYGPRFARGSYIPLGLVGVPLETVFRPLHAITGLGLFTPAISVDVVARAAVQAVSDHTVRGPQKYHEMQQLAAAYTTADTTP